MNLELSAKENSLNIINRKRINDNISAAIENNKIVYLFAPIAWGKTIAVKNYANVCGEKVKWVDLRNKSFFINDLSLEEDISSSIIILDNFQEVKEKRLLNKLVKIIKNSSMLHKFVILGRSKPPVCFSEFIIKNKMKILTSESLSFTEGEIKNFYLENQIELSNIEIKSILTYTEGWPAVMVIILMLLKLNYSIADLLSETNGYIENFIEENIWNKWDENNKKFFMSVSIFEELPIDLCRELSRQYKTEDISEYFSINKAKDSYRMNEVLCSFFKDKAKIHMQDTLPELYDQIGTWLEENNYEIEVIDLYFKTNKEEKILTLLERNYSEHIRSCNIKNIGKYLSKIVNKEQIYSPTICTLMFIFETIYSGFDERNIWYKKLIEIRETLESNSKEYVNVLLKIIYIKFNIENTRYTEIFKIYSDLLTEIPEKSLPIKDFILTEGLPSIIRGIKEYTKIMAHYKLIKKIAGSKILLIHGEDGIRVLDIGYAEFEYEKNNLNSALSILTKQLYPCENKNIDIIFTLNIILGKVLRAAGDIDKYEDIMYKLKEKIVNNKAFYLLQNYNSVNSRLYLLKGDANKAEKLLINPTGNIDIEITFLETHQYLTKARWYIAIGKYERVIILIEKLYELNLKYDCTINIIECYILKAICLYKNDDKESALETIYKALKLAQPYSYIRIFADEGESCYVILNKYAKSKHEDIREEYLKCLLSKTRNFAQLYPKYLEWDTEINNSKLTKAEVEIIHLLNKGMSNSDICDYLNIKIDTVKFHTRNIYSKLGVKSRLKAVQIAKMKRIIK